jgi:hypothetical protein
VATEREIEAVAQVLSDEGNIGLSAGEVAALVWATVEAQRKRVYKYTVIAQDRSRPAANGLREFCPTWVTGPFYTASEAGVAARALRKAHPGARVMTAQLIQPGEELDPAFVKEVLQ